MVEEQSSKHKETQRNRLYAGQVSTTEHCIRKVSRHFSGSADKGRNVICTSRWDLPWLAAISRTICNILSHLASIIQHSSQIHRTLWLVGWNNDFRCGMHRRHGCHSCHRGNGGHGSRTKHLIQNPSICGRLGGDYGQPRAPNGQTPQPCHGGEGRGPEGAPRSGRLKAEKPTMCKDMSKTCITNIYQHMINTFSTSPTT